MAIENSKLDSLTKILHQERDRGFRDSTVIGGLDRFLQRCTDDLTPVLGELGSYSVLTPPQRKSWADTVMARLKQTRNTAVSDDGTKRPARTRKPSARKAKPPLSELSLEDDIAKLRAVNNKNQPRLKRLGAEKLRDLVYLFPHRHNDFGNIRKVSQLVPGQEQTVVATVWEASETGHPRRKSTQAILGDDSGNLRVIWFNQRYLAKSLTPGTQLVISGKAEIFNGQIVFKSPEHEFLRDQEELVHTGRLVPVYPSTDGLYQRTIRRIVKEALDASVTHVSEYLPEDLMHEQME